MPTSADILDSLLNITREWRPLAIVWHGAFALAAAVMFWRKRSPQRVVAVAIVQPLVSVSALAWWSGNPFNGTVFAFVAAALLIETRAFVNQSVRVTSRLAVAAGALLMAFGLAYPHFVAAESWWTYLYAAPFGLIPCPTIAVLAGASLMFGVFGSRAWALTLGVVALAYGGIGVLALGVTIDVVLVAGAMFLFAEYSAHRRVNPHTQRDRGVESARLRSV
jgi:hypothetical protein